MTQEHAALLIVTTIVALIGFVGVLIAASGLRKIRDS